MKKTYEKPSLARGAKLSQVTAGGGSAVSLNGSGPNGAAVQ